MLHCLCRSNSFLSQLCETFSATSLHNFVKITLHCKKNNKNSSVLRPWKDFLQIAELNTQHHLHSYHIQSLCLLNQLVHHNRHFMIRQFKLHTRWWHLVEILYFSLTHNKKIWKKWEVGVLIWIRGSKTLALGLFSAESCLLWRLQST